MTRHEAIDRLRAYADAIKAMGATSLYLYGSTARDEAGAASDLDIFIDYDSRSKFNLLDLVDIMLLLELELGLAVDVTTRSSLTGIEMAVTNMSFEEFEKNWVVNHAVQRALEIISEASRRIPAEIKLTQPSIRWASIAGIGNVLRTTTMKSPTK
jgi:predicted nucleotidyltransferase